MLPYVKKYCDSFVRSTFSPTFDAPLALCAMQGLTQAKCCAHFAVQTCCNAREINGVVTDMYKQLRGLNSQCMSVRVLNKTTRCITHWLQWRGVKHTDSRRATTGRGYLAFRLSRVNCDHLMFPSKRSRRRPTPQVPCVLEYKVIASSALR